MPMRTNAIAERGREAGEAVSAAGRAPGRVSQALIRLLMRRATVAATERLTEGFTLLTLEGTALRDVAWTPGQKIQVAMGSAFVARTYTPIVWNAAAGRTCILGFDPGEGPGARWLRHAAVGDACDLLGPRASVDLRRLPGPIALFGDETAIGLGHALRHQHPHSAVRCHFEVGDEAAARDVLRCMDLDDAALFDRRADEAHLEAVEALLPALDAGGATFVLTGRAGMVQRLHRALKRHAVPRGRILTKVYWAPGKTGLD
ncbi:siderophore-interacting protein [Sphingomonas sp. ac-8]|uniref:siderophore-interacting protein n=1 Tax=Sphingomonas sp. ac-8 TaxID=3242977 RepID=UPI003A7FCA1F